MGSILAQFTPCIHHHHRNPISLRLSPPCPSILPLPPHRAPLHKRHICAFKTKPDWSRIGSTSASGGTDSSSSSSSSSRSRNSSSSSSSSSSLDGKRAAELLRKPIVSPSVEGEREESAKEIDEEEEDQVVTEKAWVDWEDQILEDTVPLVGFVRMILHSGKYENGERLSPEHEKTILERLLPYHPQCEKKIGSGVDYITSGYHPDFETSRCLFVVRMDGERVDFSYWKCIKGLIKKKYPLYADSFINKHFQNPRRTD